MGSIRRRMVLEIIQLVQAIRAGQFLAILMTLPFTGLTTGKTLGSQNRHDNRIKNVTAVINLHPLQRNNEFQICYSSILKRVFWMRQGADRDQFIYA